MNKIFIACPISKYLNGHVFINEHFKWFIDSLYQKCGNYAQNVFLALEREEYGNRLMLEQCTQLDFEEMVDSDIVIAIPEDSMGVAVELGWASVMQKKILLVLNNGDHYSPLVARIGDISPTTIIWYEGELNEKVLADVERYLNTIGR